MAQGAVAVTTTVPGSTTALTGRLAFLDNAVDATTGTIMAKASFTNEEGGLTPGQFAEVKVTVGRLHNAVVVPAQAVESGLDGPFVFVVKADSTVEIRPIKLAADVDGFSAVASGLAAGERVVTDGQSRLRAGMRIALPATSAAERSP